MAKLFLGNREISAVIIVKDVESLNVTPTTSSQIIEASKGGYSSVNVSAVTAAIDSNIQAGNIKKGITILGVTGNVEVADGLSREIGVNGTVKTPTYNFTFSLPSNAINIGSYSMYYAFYDCTGLTSVDLSSLTTISGSYGMEYAFGYCISLTSVDLSNLTTISGLDGMYRAFYYCDNLASIDLSSLTTISGTAGMRDTFRGCTSLTSVDLSNLTTISGGAVSSYGMYYAFADCIKVTSVDLSSLTTISGGYGMAYTFRGCTHLISVNLPSLSTISGYNAMQNAFSYCTSLTSLSFPALTSTSFGGYDNYFSNMLQGVTGCTVHFPSNLQDEIGYWSDVTAGFGGTNTTVLYDLPATS